MRILVGVVNVGKLVALRTVMKHMNGNGKIRERFDAATFPLVTYHERDFPPVLREALKRIIDARIKCRRDISPTYTVFAFDELTPTERKQIVTDLTALYEGCLIDIGILCTRRAMLLRSRRGDAVCLRSSKHAPCGEGGFQTFIGGRGSLSPTSPVFRK